MAEQLISDADRDRMTKADLLAEAKRLKVQGVDDANTKAEIAEAINAHAAAQGGGEGDGEGATAGQAVRGGAQASDRDADAEGGARARFGDRAGEEGDGGEAERLRREREDDAALRAGDNLDRGRPPTAAEVEAANRQGAKSPAQLAQEQADAILRQGQAGVGAQFQPPEGEKPAYIARGAFVNPDGRKATRANMLLRPDAEDEE